MGGKYMIVVDGAEAGDYNDCLNGLGLVKFDSPGSCHFIMIKNKTLILVDVEITGEH
jgi:hypothetical protein